jgi:uncharacterized protein GlcG (DUF336 family)
MTVTLAEAIAWIDRGLLRAQELKIRVSLAVVDSFGQLMQLDRMDGAALMSPDIAEAKAVTAMNFKRPTREVGALDDRTLTALKETVHFTVVPLAGGIPIARDGELVGAIGVSGATAEQDEDVARHAVS